MGELGLRPAEFYDLTWSEYQRAAIGYKIRIDRGWDYTRNMMAASLGAFSSKAVRPGKLIKCIFDDRADVDPVTMEEWEHVKKVWKIASA